MGVGVLHPGAFLPLGPEGRGLFKPAHGQHSRWHLHAQKGGGVRQ